MGAQAVALAQRVDYVSAGTVEFIVDPARNFYFLEMNTRLQVEHPVTELVTGLDLVEWMIRIAAGERLPFGQDGVRLRGWAIEARIYAEDPTRNFVPSTGRLTRYRPPTGPDLRTDTGVYEGAEISMFYDPMIAKLVARGDDRPAATAAMARALDAFELAGIGNNVEFLAALVALPEFGAGALSTNLIAEHFPHGFKPALPEPAELARRLALAAARQHAAALRDATLSGQRARLRQAVSGDWVVRLDGANHAVAVTPVDDGMDVRLDGVVHRVRGDLAPAAGRFDGTVDDVAMVVRIAPAGLGQRLARGGTAVAVQVLRPRAAELIGLMPVKAAADMSRFLLSPMPGLLVRVAVAEGAEVKIGEPLAVVEAMKMENVLRAERDGTVKRIVAAAGASLAVDQVILEFA